MDGCAKRHHGYDTDSSALVSDSGSDDSGDGDSDATMQGFFLGGVGGASSGHKTVGTKYVPSKGPFLPNNLLT